MSWDNSVGGGDYGSVRVGTYMGRKMIKCAAANFVSVSSTTDAPAQSDDYEEKGRDVLSSEASMEYLCNLPPHRSHLPYVILL
jgi:L-arabinokinase